VEFVSIVEKPSVEMVTVRVSSGRTTTISVIMVLIGIVVTLAFGLGVIAGAHSQITFTPVNLVNAPWHLGALTLVTRWANIVLGLVIVAIGVESLVRRSARGLMVRFGVSAILFFMAVLLWAARSPGPSQIGFVNLTAVLIGTAGGATVLIYGALSGVMCERAGVVNIAINGQFIGGAFIGAVVDSTTHNFFFAAIAGAGVGALIGLLLAFLSIRYLSDQIIVGVVIVTMLASLASYLNLQILTPYPQFNTGSLAPNLPIPLLSKIPVLGPVFFNQSGFFYLMIVLIGVISFALFKTRYGLHVRAVGEHPHAAATVGINVMRVRYINVVLGGAVAGIGGVALVAAQGNFQPGIDSGFGYIALAAMIFGRWRPSGAVVASVLFGFSVYIAYALKSIYQLPISSEILNMFPYVITIFVVSGLVGRVRAPAADGLPYHHD
jgi:simple sugar transport system permease protein